MSNIERSIVAKFGGSSMADAESIRRVTDIIMSDPNRRFVVVSAPGINSQYSTKITTLLEMASTPPGLPISNGQFAHRELNEAALDDFSRRFLSISRELGVSQASSWIEEVRDGICSGRDRDWSMSRGEWLMARIFADYLGATFIDAEEIVRLDGTIHINPISYVLTAERLAKAKGIYVIPGFYGRDNLGQVKTFPRGGSDITGAIIARSVNAKVYENWTDVNGVLAANPKIVSNPKTIEQLTYEEMRELGNGGASVLQRDTILPLIDANIPINVRNTFNPIHPGTMIVPERPRRAGEHVIGVAGEGGLLSVNIQKYGMNEEIGIGSRILWAFRVCGIPYEHSPSGRDYISVLVNEAQDHCDENSSVIFDIKEAIQPDRIWVQRNLGILLLMGQGIKDHTASVSGRLFSALDSTSIPVRAFSYGASGISMIVVVDNSRLADAQRIAYTTFVQP